jgi:outer membrane receptor protein involved in Fe transport
MNRFHLFSSRVISLMLCVLLLASFGIAQTSRGTVTGTVTDSSGAVVPNAAVTLTSAGTGVASTVKTNEAGIYRFEAVLAGDYTVSVKANGFGESKMSATVAAGLTTGRDFTLKIAGTGESVTVEASAVQLQTEEAARGGAISSDSLASLPISGQNSLNLMLVLPGVVRSNQGGSLDGGIGAVNGARARSNNFMIDGSANNDSSVAGPGLVLTNNDALQEVAVQTSNFTAEFGRSGGAIVNQITKSGTNQLHGTVATIYRSEVLNASTATQRTAFGNKQSTTLKNKFKENIPAFTIGGPVLIPGVYDGHNKTFFFVAGQWDRYSGTSPTDFVVPTAAGFNVLQPLAATCPNVAKYLSLLGDRRASDVSGTSNISIALPTAVAATSCGGGARTGQVVQIGTYTRESPRVYLDNNHMVRIDHVASSKQNMSFRWLMDTTSDTSGNVGVSPDFDVPYNGRTMGANFNHVYVVKNNLVNEFRFSYTRFNFGWWLPNENSLGATTPDIGITSLSYLTLSASYPQGRVANTFQYQDTMGWTSGKHSVRFGGEIMRQNSVQVAPFNYRGSLTYSASVNNAYTGGAITGLANFIDNYSGPSGGVAISFGSGQYRPNLFTYAGFIQDSYKIRNDLTLTYGVRYENFGQPANGFKYPAFVGYNDGDILSTAKVKKDGNNFGPNLGFSWNPRLNNGLLSKLTGNGKTVLRGGYGVSYDTWYNNLLSNMAAGSPNALANTPISAASSATQPRGIKNLSAVLPTLTPVAVTPYSSQTSMFSQGIRNPYYHRFSLGVQRELPSQMIVDLSYVGTLGRQLLFTNPLNPALPNAAQNGVGVQANGQILRVHANRGLIQVRDSGLTSSYNAMQLQVRRKFANTAVGGIAFNSAYTWSKNLDVLSETFASNSSGQNPSRSPLFGPLKAIDWGPADNDRRHVWSTVLQWNVRAPQKGVLGQVLGGWSVAPIFTVQSGTPFTVLNGADRDFDNSTLGDRPDIGNPAAPINTFARTVGTSVCSTGLQNPANNACVTPNDVRWVQVTTYSPTSSKMAGRNSAYTGGYFTMDANILKTFKIGERYKFEYRAEIFNLTNNQNFDTPVASSYRTLSSATGTNFLNYGYNYNAGSRTMRMGLKVTF